MKILKGIFSCLVIFIVIALVAAGVIVWQSYRFWLQAPNNEEVVINVEEGSSLRQIAKKLKDEKAIADVFWFKIYTKLDGSSRNFKAGTFSVPAGQSYALIVDQMTEGEAGEVTVTIPEGYTLDQIGDLMIKNFEITQEDWDLWTGSESPLESHEFIAQAKPDDVDLEGYLFPDTYRFFNDATAEDIVATLVDQMQKKYDSLGIVRQDVASSAFVSNQHDVLTLASIVQREVLDPDEMANVADIFLKRLDIGMALQADSTVNYVTGKDTPAISLEDRDIESAYNTYQYPGLPPGPISNPGLDAIKAVFNPLSNPYYYFLTTSEGEVFYAQTHDEHVANKNKHLR
ncbi:MAG: endolytic transglycosylase MltG [Patescibacteria group bacterium]